MDGMFLDDDELRSMTHRVQRAAQARVLRSMGIEHRARPDGSLAVLRAHVEQTFGAAAAAKRKKTPTEPNWGAVSATRAQ
jgi:Domain of unknown function (DUF4224)